MAVLNNTVSLPKEAVSTLTDLSGWCLVVSIAALGVKTSLDKLS
ncbi:MAG: putative sulfate exporter family transporter [Burkholderiaceae bacterium]